MIFPPDTSLGVSLTTVVLSLLFSSDFDVHFVGVVCTMLDGMLTFKTCGTIKMQEQLQREKLCRLGSHAKRCHVNMSLSM